MEIAIGAVAALMLLVIVYIFVFIRPRTGMKRYFRENEKELFTDYAHRGLHGGSVPENSLAAFRRAVENGHGIELDLQLSRDGEVMVFHDYSLVRMTGVDKKLSELDSAELRGLRLSDSGERIPFFSEVLEMVGGKVPLLIELKGESGDTSVCAAADKILRGYDGRYCVESFNPLLLRWFRRNHGDVMRGILVTSVGRERRRSPLSFCLTTLLTNIVCRPDFIAYDVRYPNSAVDICVHFFSAPAFAWTVRDEHSYNKAREGGAYVIFENIKPFSDDM